MILETTPTPHDGTKALDFKDSVLNPMTDEALIAVARNESSMPPWRKAALKLLVQRAVPLLTYPDLREMVRTIDE